MTIFSKLKKIGWDVSGENHGLLIAEDIFKDQMTLLDNSLSQFNLTCEEGLIVSGGQKAIPTDRLTKIIEDLGWLENTVTVENEIDFSHPDQENKKSFFSSHKIDHIGSGNCSHNKFALEIEWNNKDEFFDRDFVAIRGLYESRAIELGIIITRGEGLEEHIKKEVGKYFIKEKVNSYQGIDKLKKKLKTKGHKFSFPSSSLKSSIDSKVSKGIDFTTACQEVFCSSKFGSTTTNWDQLKRRMKRRAVGRTPLIKLGIPPAILK